MNPTCSIARVLLAVLTLGCAGVASGADDPRDHFTIGDQPYAGYVVQELSDTIIYKGTPDGQSTSKHYRILKSIEYAGMRQDGLWRKGQEARTRGEYEDAAALFDQLAGGQHSWEQVYGAIAEGDCLELAKKYAAAADCFQKVVGLAPFDKDDATVPRPRQWMDACYRLGMALAEANKIPEATKVADGLSTYGQLNGALNSLGAEERANAIRSAMSAAQNDSKDLDNYSSKVSFDAGEEPAVWFHYNIYLAGAWNAAQNPGNALNILNHMIDEPELAKHPADQSKVYLLRGLDNMTTDPTAALIDLLRIDILPYSSEDERCMARAAAGSLLLDQAAKIGDAPKDDRQAAYRKELLRTARLVLAAAADASTHIPEKDKAKALLDGMGADEDAPAAPPAAPTSGGAPAPADSGASTPLKPVDP